ncbi:MAG: hypothetical protein NTV04_05945 [Deltaproteobacteria bacterium]|nr:hypothetical protein [Deltaproteobacteria bacterium]
MPRKVGAARRAARYRATRRVAPTIGFARLAIKTIVLVTFYEIISFEEAKLLKVFGMFLLIFLLPISGWPQMPAATPGKPLSIVFSANVHGEVEPCG